MAWAGLNEAGVMGEEETLLRSLHFLELMTSLRARGTVPLTPSGSCRAHHGPVGMQRRGAGGREVLRESRAASGQGCVRCRRQEQGVIVQCLQAPHCCSPSLSPSFPFFLYDTFYKKGQNTKIQSFIRRTLASSTNGRQKCISFINSTYFENNLYV